MDRILPQSFLIVQRRVDLMTSEGIRFITNANVGQEISAEELHKNNDAVSLKIRFLLLVYNFFSLYF